MTSKTYNELLRDPRWIEFREDIIQSRKGYDDPPMCEHCGRSEKITVHHRRYIEGLLPWEYQEEDLIVLCWPCHKQVHESARRLYAFAISLPPQASCELANTIDFLYELSTVSIAKLMARMRNEACHLKECQEISADDQDQKLLQPFKSLLVERLREIADEVEVGGKQ